MKKTTFECPWCGNELSKSKKDTIKCEFCGEIIVPANDNRRASALYNETALKNRQMFGGGNK